MAILHVTKIQTGKVQTASTNWFDCQAWDLTEFLGLFQRVLFGVQAMCIAIRDHQTRIGIIDFRYGNWWRLPSRLV